MMCWQGRTDMVERPLAGVEDRSDGADGRTDEARAYCLCETEADAHKRASARP